MRFRKQIRTQNLVGETSCLRYFFDLFSWHTIPLGQSTSRQAEVAGESSERRNASDSLHAGLIHFHHRFFSDGFMYSLTNTASSKSIEDRYVTQDYDSCMELRERIYKARNDANLTQEQLAAVVGKTRGAVSQWESGEVRPRHSTLMSIAKATGKDLGWLESGMEPAVSGMRVIGEVAAGLWKEGSVEFKPYGQPVAPHPGYPAHAQRLYKVSGNSVNRLVEDGAYIHCVDIAESGMKPEHGDLVVVCRQEHGLSEYTAKRLIIENGHKTLRPESTDEQWQADIVLNGGDDTHIFITDIVIAKWSPIKRGF